MATRSIPSGAFVRTPRPFPVDDLVAFELDLPDGLVPVHAVVRWRRLRGGPDGPVGMGVEFVESTPDVVTALTAFVHRARGA